MTSHGGAEWRQSPLEQKRVKSLMDLTGKGANALDIGARDGYLSRKLADSFDSVTALDLGMPDISHPKITPVQGDVTALQYPDGTFDCVLCAEVLEHVPSEHLEKACKELVRVTRKRLVIGVPFREDSRLGRTRCTACGRANPPWGHVNSFDEPRLRELFGTAKWSHSEFVGDGRKGTNAVSSALMDYAGNPYGTYEQDEPCVYCGATLEPPTNRSLPQKVATRASVMLHSALLPLMPLIPNWIHILFEPL